MHIMFVCSGMAFNGGFMEEGKSLGGSETACYYVAREMAKFGHKVVVFTNEQQSGHFDGVDYTWCGPPSERWPLGEYVHAFMETTFVDAMILQRATGIHAIPHAARMAFLWLHDVALVRQVPSVRRDSYLYDGLLAVSDWHRNQIRETWDMKNSDAIHIIPNAVDRELYKDVGAREYNGKELRLLYQSRFERGIDYLVKPGGIMEQLAKRRPGAMLTVCGYANFPEHMRPYYEQVTRWMQNLPNVQFVGYLSKKDLARLQAESDILVYPGEFEETSCITAMEAQAAGLPMLGSACGALPETCGPGAKLLPLQGGHCDIDAFVNFLSGVDPTQLRRMHNAQLESAEQLSWEKSARKLEDLLNSTLVKRQSNVFSMVRSMLDLSDVRLAQYYITKVDDNQALSLVPELKEIVTSYTPISADAEAHYDSDDAVADIARSGGNLDVTMMMRFQEAAFHLMEKDPSNVLDYGCQKGHSIWSLAQKYKNAHYTGIDISPRIIDWARENCKIPGVNIRFESGDVFSESFDYSKYGKYDALLLGEVLEHVEDPVGLMQRLEPMLMDGGRVVLTTPFGDWEGKDYYNNPHAARYHLYHFERADLSEMFGHHEGFLVSCVPAGYSHRNPLGSFVTSFTYHKDVPLCKPLDMDRKMAAFTPRQTLSFCALAKDSESTILRSLMTVKDLVDEFIVAVDKDSTDSTLAILEQFRDTHAGYRRFEILQADSPLVIGFDEARNRTIAKARGDWILWMDNDEDMVYPERLIKYLRNNMFDGYGIAQHHWSSDPVGILTTDWPVRVFRNNDYLKFRGVVHEHPDDMKYLNRGPRTPAQLMDFHIVHHGYTTEPVRRARFYRNLPLIKRDRKQYPDRTLGRLLWLRDLSHMCMFELERTRGVVTGDCLNHAQEGIAEWEQMLEQRKDPIVSRMIRDGVEFYSTLVSVMGQGFDFDVQMHASKGMSADVSKGPRRKARFLNREHLDKYIECCLDEQTMKFDSKYF